MEEQLISYIEKELKRGVSRPAVKKALLDVGWNLSLIEEAFVQLQAKAAAPAPFASGNSQKQIENSNYPEKENSGNAANKETRPKKGKLMMVAGGVFAVIIVGFVLAVAYLDSQDSSWEAEENIIKYDANGIAGGGAAVAEQEAGMPEDLPAENLNDTVAVIETGESDPLAFGGGAASIESADEVAAEGADTPESMDERRIADMKKLISAQEAWYGANGKYYTCGLRGGDCGGMPYGYPAKIGDYLASMPQDPLYDARQAVCGQDYVYCGLNNASYPHFFCYYAKLEAGGYYTASHAGNFTRSTPPKIFEECAVAN